MNYYEKNVSNYFKVRNEFEFKKELIETGLLNTIEESHNNPGTFCVCTDDIYSYDEESDEEYGYNDLTEIIRKNICYNQKVFLSTIGSEGYRYFTSGCSTILPYKIHYDDLFNHVRNKYNQGKDIF